MRKYAQTTLFLILLTAGVPAFASTATDFYLELLRRGTSDVEGGRHEAAVTPLRLAAFGLVDSITHYETAQTYLAVALDHLGKSDEARRAAQRVISAESVERRYATLPLPPSIRTAFMAVARKTLNAGELSALNGSTQASTAPSQIPVTAPPPRSTAVPTRNGGTSTPITPAATTEKPQPAKVQPPQTSTQRPAATTTNSTPPKPAATTTNSTPPKPAATTTNSTPPKPAATSANSTVPQPAATSANSTVPQPAATSANSTPPKPAATTTNSTPPKPAATTTNVTPPKPAATAAPKPQQAVSAPKPATPAATAPAPRVDVPARLTAGDRALSAANLPEARRAYRELLTVTTLDRATLIRTGEGLYRARDFAGALSAFRRLGALKAGEEAYRYYVAVALYETGDLAAAKRELASALPFIEVTEDVQRYRAKIEGSRN